MTQPLVAVIMGSQSDWSTMQHAVAVLEALGVPYETKVVSAHRTPDLVTEYVGGAESRGVRVVIAGAGGAAHLPVMAASNTVLPVLGVPVASKTLNGLDSLLSIARMPPGVPVGMLGIGEHGATSAGVLAVEILAVGDAALRDRVRAYRERLAREDEV